MKATITRRSMLAGAAAAGAQVLFRTTIRATTTQQLAAAPGRLDLTLTAMSSGTLRIGIAPATSQATEHELAFVDRTWPPPLEPSEPPRAQTLAWGKYALRIDTDPLTITLLERERTRQQIHFEPDSSNIHFLLDGPIFGLSEGSTTFDHRNSREPRQPDRARPHLRRSLTSNSLGDQSRWLGHFHRPAAGNIRVHSAEGIFRRVKPPPARNMFVLLGDGPAECQECA
jgi:hypothetical protein